MKNTQKRYLYLQIKSEVLCLYFKYTYILYVVKALGWRSGCGSLRTA